MFYQTHSILTITEYHRKYYIYKKVYTARETVVVPFMLLFWCYDFVTSMHFVCTLLAINEQCYFLKKLPWGFL